MSLTDYWEPGWAGFVFPVLAVAFAALCVWLTVRIINRPERWAKWTLAAVVGVPVLYVLSFVPACWWFSSDTAPMSPFGGFSFHNCRYAPRIYWPIGQIVWNGPEPIRKAIGAVATSRGECVMIPLSWSGYGYVGAP